MEFRVATAGRGLNWFRGAVRMLDCDPRGLLTVVAVMALIQQVPNLLSAVPSVSIACSVLLLLCGPALLAGVMFAIHEAYSGRPVSPMQLCEGLRRPGARSQLLWLGVIGLLLFLLMGAVAQRILGDDNLAILKQIAEQKLQPQDAPMEKLAVPIFETVMAAVAILFVLLAGWFFAVPRVFFDARRALPAFAESFLACAANVLPLTVYGLIFVGVGCVLGLVIGIVAVVLGLLGKLGALLFMLVMVVVYAIALLVSASGNYLAWRDTFGHGDTPEGTQNHGSIVV